MARGDDALAKMRAEVVDVALTAENPRVHSPVKLAQALADLLA
jgi:hypothetical protein